jgi:hypothetical protein
MRVRTTDKPPAQPSSELYVAPWIALVDNSEQAPWSFQGIYDRLGPKGSFVPVMIRTRRVELKTGDYTISGLEDRLTIERKSGADFIGSVTGGHVRFEREHERMAAMVNSGGFCCVVVEDSLDSILDSLPPLSGKQSTILGTAASWPSKYNVPWYFAGSRLWAERFAYRFLCRAFDKLTRGE